MSRHSFFGLGPSTRTAGVPSPAPFRSTGELLPRPQIGQPAGGSHRAPISCRAVEKLPLHVEFPDTDNRYLVRSPLPSLQRQDTQLRLLTDDTLGLYRSGFTNMKEMDYYLDAAKVEGTLPEEIQGTFLMNGPGKFHVNGRRITNPFDGDGMICSLAFKEDNIFFRSRFVKTPRTGQTGASAFEKPQISGISWPFGIKLPTEFPLPANIFSKNPANQGVLCFGRRVLALHECASPLLLDGSTLDTVTDTQALRAAIEGPLAPNYRVLKDADGLDMYVALGISPSGSDAVATVYEFAHNSELLQKAQVKLPGAANGFINDIAVTDNYYLLVEHPCEVDLEKLVTKHLLGGASAAECIFLNKARQTKIHVIPRREAEGGNTPRVQTILTSPLMTLKHINAYELDGGERIVLDTNLWSEFDFSFNVGTASVESLSQSPAPVVARLDINLATSEVQGRILSARPCSFSSLHPDATGRPHDAVFLAVAGIDGMAGPPQALMRLASDPLQGSNCSVGSILWEPGPGKFVGPLTFVPRSGDSKGGWLMTVIYDGVARTSSLAILDSDRLLDGPVASIHFGHALPHGLQGVFSQGTYLGPAKTAPKGWTPTLHPSAT